MSKPPYPLWCGERVTIGADNIDAATWRRIQTLAIAMHSVLTGVELEECFAVLTLVLATFIYRTTDDDPMQRLKAVTVFADQLDMMVASPAIIDWIKRHEPAMRGGVGTA